MKKQLILFVLCLPLFTACFTMSSKGLLGVATLEESYSPSKSTGEFLKDTNKEVRIIFFKDSSWVARKTPLRDGSYKFHQVLKNENLGNFVVKSEDNSFEKTDFNQLKKVDAEKYDFFKWTGSKNFYPVVLTHDKAIVDPENWEEGYFVDARNNLQEFYIAHAKTKSLCDKKTGLVRSKMDILPVDLNTVASYRRPTGAMIVGFRIKQQDESQKCWPPNAPKQQGSSWLHVDSGGEITFIGYSMEFIDYGDYDGDGSSEWLFYLGLEDRYLLYEPSSGTAVKSL